MSDPLLLLDEGPLSLVTNPRESARAKRCKEWLRAILARGYRVMVPGIAEYELRRELIRADRRKGLARLDDLIEQLGVLPVDMTVLRYAARLWAEARNAGIPTADDKALDADMILAATALLAAVATGGRVVIVTTNVAHLARFAPAAEWEEISP